VYHSLVCRFSFSGPSENSSIDSLGVGIKALRMVTVSVDPSDVRDTFLSSDDIEDL